MGKYSVEITETAREDLQRLFRSGNKSLVKKVETVFVELSEHPMTGTGKPEQLKHVNNLWSRRLDKKNRMIYTISEEIITVFVISVKGHYGDK